MKARSLRRGLTILELVVCVAALAILISAIVPAIKRSADQTRDQRENFAAKLLTRALASYALDNADALVLAHPNWNWVHFNATPGMPAMHPHDPYNNARLLQGTIAKTYMSHLADGRGITPADMQVDPATAALFASRPTTPSSIQAPNLCDFDPFSAQAGVLWHPSFGYNGVFVGGSYRHGAFTDPPFGLTNNQYGGAFYLQRMSQAVAPSRLIAFASARGGDVASGSWWGFGTSYPNGTPMRPGYWLVTPPRGTMPNVSAWVPGDTFNPQLSPSLWGNVDCRAGSSKATVAQLDGSNQALSLTQLRDMRRWANQATSPNWNWLPGLNAAP